MQYRVIALGGTFDIIHIGHIELLKKGFSISEKVIIGLTSDEFALKNGKKLLNNYEKRHSALKSLIEKKFQNSKFHIAKLENEFGPAVMEDDVEALVVSTEMQHKGNILNKIRIERNLSPVDVVSVSMVLGQDGERISTTRIRNNEIDSNGNSC